MFLIYGCPRQELFELGGFQRRSSQGARASQTNENGMLSKKMVMPAWRRIALIVGTAAAALWTISACWRHVEGSAHDLLRGSASRSQVDVSATVTPASSVRCNRIQLPARLQNATTGPYNPAAARHPVTGEWLLLHTLDEVRARCLRSTKRYVLRCAPALSAQARALHLNDSQASH